MGRRQRQRHGVWLYSAMCRLVQGGGRTTIKRTRDRFRTRTPHDHTTASSSRTTGRKITRTCEPWSKRAIMTVRDHGDLAIENRG